MSEFLDQKELDEWLAQRRLSIQADAIVQRAASAGVPKEDLALKDIEFRELLDDKIYGGEELENKITFFVYKNANKLIKTPFIFIEGGCEKNRNRAAHAILFRMIACDMFGSTYLGSTLGGIFGDMKQNRNEFVNKLKNDDSGVLLIKEFSNIYFKYYSEAGTFFDDFLRYRRDKKMPTIITFSNPIDTIYGNIKDETICGNYLPTLLGDAVENSKNLENNPSGGIFQVRVKKEK